MTSPIKPLPEDVNRWYLTRAAGLRWCDAVVAWLALSALAFWLLDLRPVAAAALGLALVALGSQFPSAADVMAPLVSGAWASR